MIVSILGALGTVSLIILFYILARLSERFGSVIKMPPLYRYYYLGMVFLAVGCLTHLIVATRITSTLYTPAWLVAPWFLLLAYHLPLGIGVTIGLIITWRYWSWLVTERDK